MNVIRKTKKKRKKKPRRPQGAIIKCSLVLYALRLLKQFAVYPILGQVTIILINWFVNPHFLMNISQLNFYTTPVFTSTLVSLLISFNYSQGLVFVSSASFGVVSLSLCLSDWFSLKTRDEEVRLDRPSQVETSSFWCLKTQRNLNVDRCVNSHRGIYTVFLYHVSCLKLVSQQNMLYP